MNRIRWQSCVHYLALALLLAACWMSYHHFEKGRTRFGRVQQDLEEAAALAQQIKLLRQKPDRAAASSRSEQSLAEAIEKSTAAAGLARDQIARIDPQPPRRAGDTDYLEHATTVQIDAVRLDQLAQAMQALRSMAGLDQLRVAAMRISTPYQAASSEGPETWNVELTLTYYVYSPKPAARQRS
jgi:type II secretory pathway component PulM